MAKAQVELRDRIILTVDEAGALIGRSGKAVTNLVKNGLLPALELMGTTMIYVESLHEFAREHLGKSVRYENGQVNQTIIVEDRVT